MTTDASPILFAPGDSLDGRWTVQAALPGAMGTVLIVEDPTTGARFAAKTPRLDRDLDERTVQRFETEARTWLSLGQHVNVVEALFFEEIECAGRPRPFLFLEYVDGTTLDRVLAQEERLAVPVVLDVATGIAWGMAHAHGERRDGPRIVHRDLKPANVFLTYERVVKVSDFGIARALDRADEVADAGAGLGTPFYCAPEQMKNAGAAELRSDVYAFGAVVHHLVTGAPPFPAETLSQLVWKVLRETPQPMSDWNPAVPEQLDRLVLACLAKDPADRPHSFSEVLADVSEVREIDALWAPPAVARSCAACGWLSSRALGRCSICGHGTAQGRRYAPVSSRLAAQTPTLGRSGGGEVVIEGVEVRPRAPRVGEDVLVTVLLGNPGSEPVDHVVMPHALPDRDGFVRAQGRRRGFRGSVPPTAPGAPLRVSWSMRPLVEGEFQLPAPRASYRDGDGRRRVVRGKSTLVAIVADAEQPLVGRDAEASALLGCLDAAQRGGSALVVLLGRPGMGKSRLGRVLRRAATRHGFLTARGRSVGRGVESRSALKEVLRRLTGLRGRVRQPAEAASAVVELLGQTARTEPGLVDFLVGELLGLPVARDDSPANMWARFAGVLAARRPLLVILEDVQRDLDTATIALEMAAHAQRQGKPFLALLTGRATLEDEPAGREVVRRVEDGDLHLSCARVLRLEPLDPQAVATLMDAEFSPNDFDTSLPWLAARVHELSGGSPLFVSELARALRRSAAGPPCVVARDGRWTAREGLTPADVDRLLPARAEQMVLRRLGELPESAARFVRGASVLGDVFRVDLLRKVLGDPSDFAESLAAVEREGILREIGGEPARLRFREPVLPEILRRELAAAEPEESRRLNESAAEHLAATPDPGQRNVLRLARHLARAGRAEDAFPKLLAAGWRMAERQAYREAAHVLGEAEELRRASGLRPRRADRVNLHLLRGETLRFTGEYSAALDAYRGIVKLSGAERPSTAVMAGVYGRMGKIHESLGQLEEALYCYAVGLSLREESGDAAGIPMSLVNMAGLHLLRGEGKRASAYVEQALAASRGDVNLRARGRAFVLRARVAIGRGRTAEARRDVRTALSLARAAHDKVGAADAWNALGTASHREGRSRRALAHFRRALYLRQASGDLPAAGASWNNLGAVHEALGDVGAAMRDYERAVETYRRIESRRGLGVALGNLGRLQLLEGRPRRARVSLMAARDAHGDAGDPIATALTVAELGRTEMALGALDAAEELLRQAVRLVANRGDNEAQAGVALARAELAAAGRDTTAARDALRAALALEGVSPALRTVMLSRAAELDQDPAAADEAVRVAADGGNPRVRAHALAARGRLSVAAGEVAAGAALLRRAAGLLWHPGAADPLLLSVLESQAEALHESDPAAAEAALRRSREVRGTLERRGFVLAPRRPPAGPEGGA